MEFKLITAIDKDGCMCSALIDAHDFKKSGGDPYHYFVGSLLAAEPNFEVGDVVIEGQIENLDSQYTSLPTS